MKKGEQRRLLRDWHAIGILYELSSNEACLASSSFRLVEYDMKKFLARLRRDDEGASLVEYGLLVALIAVVCIAAVTLLGTTIAAQFTAITSAM